MMKWATADMVMPEAALASESDNIAITLIEKDDHWCLCWAINVKGPDATLPNVEAIAEGVAAVIRHYMELEWHGDYEPDDGS